MGNFLRFQNKRKKLQITFVSFVKIIRQIPII